MFVTVWLGLLDLRDGTLRCCNAGHEYPILKQPDGSFELIKDKHGLALGSLADAKYSEYTLKLEPGAKLFVYTDGIPEASNLNGQMFTVERTIEQLNKDLDKSPEEILTNMKKAVDEFVENREPFDDLTMMCIHYKGQQL
jgi:sigma-B regulation protein RsbU (phosphoserine phosphatase)